MIEALGYLYAPKLESRKIILGVFNLILVLSSHIPKSDPNLFQNFFLRFIETIFKMF